MIRDEWQDARLAEMVKHYRPKFAGTRFCEVPITEMTDDEIRACVCWALTHGKFMVEARMTNADEKAQP